MEPTIGPEDPPPTILEDKATKIEQKARSTAYSDNSINELSETIESGNYTFESAYRYVPPSLGRDIDGVLKISSMFLLRGNSAHLVSAADVLYSSPKGPISLETVVKPHTKIVKARTEMMIMGKVLQEFITTVPLGLTIKNKDWQKSSEVRGFLLSEVKNMITADMYNWSNVSGIQKLRFLSAVGHLVAQYHNFGLFHNDIQLKNIAIDYTLGRNEEGIFLIDFENCQRTKSDRPLKDQKDTIVRGLRVFLNSVFWNRKSFMDAAFQYSQDIDFSEMDEKEIERFCITRLIKEVTIDSYYAALIEIGVSEENIRMIKERIDESFETGEIWSSERLRRQLRFQNTSEESQASNETE